MRQRMQFAGLILFLIIYVMHNDLSFGADGAFADTLSNSQVSGSMSQSDATLLPAQTESVRSPDKVLPERKAWTFRIGGGTILSPAFLGSSNYQLLAVPALKLTYRDAFFASVEDGVGYAIINQDGWRAGPVVKISFGRNEDGNSTFRVLGSKTSALRGLGNIPATIEAGAFAEYRWRSMNSKIGLRKGLNGHEGLVGDLSVSYTNSSKSLYPKTGSSLVFSIGPRLTVVDATYNKAFFGVDSDQAVRSGLPRHSPGGGILSYGVGSVIVLPITNQLSATFLAGYDRLTGDAASSPLVRERGSPDQGMMGVLFGYEFGY